MRTAIVIPARYASTRLPGKPLAVIAGQTLLSRVVTLAKAAAQNDPDIDIIVATDDNRIAAHATELNVRCAMTPTSCATGTDRAALAIQQLDHAPDFVVNMQGDAPLTPPDFVRALIDSFNAAPCDLITPVVQLSWSELDRLRDNKKVTPFSGTTATFHPTTGEAYWFSKNIIPAIRKESDLRTQSDLSPIYRHIGLYGYRRETLEAFITLPESYYEAMEGLEQLRMIENGYGIRCVPVSYHGRANMSGIDSPEDITRAETLIAEHGELVS